MRRFLILLLGIHAKFFTLLDFGSCRFYPSCSGYAHLHIAHNHLGLAFVGIVWRILRCHQLSKGGVEYPVIWDKALASKLHQVQTHYNVVLNFQCTTNTPIQAWLVPMDLQRGKVLWIPNFITKKHRS